MISDPDRSKRAATVAVVVAVAAFAAVQSYDHIRDLAHSHGQHGVIGSLVPLSVDGLILAAALVLVQPVSRRTRTLARLMLWSGIGATIAANVVYGLGYGVLGAIISAWPAYAFIGGVEMLLGVLYREAARVHVPEAVPGPAGNGHRYPEAAEAFAAELAAGEVPGIRRIRRELHIGQPKAEQVQAYLRTLTGAAAGG